MVNKHKLDGILEQVHSEMEMISKMKKIYLDSHLSKFQQYQNSIKMIESKTSNHFKLITRKEHLQKNGMT